MPRSFTLELPENFLADLLDLADRQGRCLNEIATALGHARNIQTVLAGPEGEVSPPLTISHTEVDEMMALIVRCLDLTLEEVQRKGWKP
jgi:hypothetical protein